MDYVAECRPFDPFATIVIQKVNQSRACNEITVPFEEPRLGRPGFTPVIIGHNAVRRSNVRGERLVTGAADFDIVGVDLDVGVFIGCFYYNIGGSIRAAMEHYDYFMFDGQTL